MPVEKDGALSGKAVEKGAEFKDSWRKSALKESPFLTRENVILCDLWDEQTPHVVSAFLDMYEYEIKDGRNRDVFFLVLRERKFTITVFYEERFLQLAFDNIMEACRRHIE